MSKQFRPTPIYRAVVQLALLSAGGVALAQTQPAEPDKPGDVQTVVVKGQRAALQSAQKIKQNAEEVVDSVVGEEAGKLPDKSITEVLQRVVGVTVERQRSTNNDPKHFSEEGSGIRVRGLSWGSSNLNGREVFSAGWPGRDLSWGAVPSELMSAVDVYKNPSAEKIEGGVSGLVDLRTHLPFDFGGSKGYISFGSNYEARSRKASPAVSGLYSTVWDAESGHWGALIDLAVNNSSYEQQHLDVQPYFPRTDVVAGKTVWAPNGASWGQNLGTSDRQGFYGALQWKKNDMQSALTYFFSRSLERNTGSNIYPSMESPYKSVIDNPVIDERGAVVSGHYRYPTGGLGANNFADGGIGMGTSRAFNEHRTRTGELAWNFKWNINERWSLQNDLQWVKSTFKTRGEEVQTATFIPSMDINTSAGTGPVQLGFDQKTRDFLANPDNYYWLSVMPGRLKGEANLYAWKADGKFRFDDPVLRDLTFGLRTTYRNSVREAAVYAGDTGSVGWKSIAEPWAVRQTKIPGTLPTGQDDPTWAPRANFAYLSDPRYHDAAATEVYNYGAFGGNQPPSVVFPTYAALKDYNTYAKLIGDVRYQQCLDSQAWARAQNPPLNPPTCDPASFKWDTTLHYGLNPNMISNVAERTHAVYGNLRFGFDDWPVPMEGNAGVRVVYTGRVSHGHTVLNTNYTSTTAPDVPHFAAVNDPLDVTSSHVDAMPSMNLKFNLSGDNKLIGRFAAARSLYRPDFNQLQESVSLSQNIDTTNHLITYTGNNTGNAKLKPLKSDNFDLALEWYPRSGQMLAATVFYKDVKDLVYNLSYNRSYLSEAGNAQSFTITGPRNAARAWVHGIELNAETYLDHFEALKDKLPDWAKGFGVSANYTYIGSSQKFYRDAQVQYCPANGTITSDSLKVYGCDTNGMPFAAGPLPGLVKNAANLALRYDRNGFSARLAYNWTTRVLKALGNDGLGSTSGSNGTSADPARAGAHDTWWGLPRWQEAYGQWDGGVSYNFSEHFNMSLSVTNLNNVTVRYTNQQGIGFMGTSWDFPGRSYYLTGRYEF